MGLSEFRMKSLKDKIEGENKTPLEKVVEKVAKVVKVEKKKK